MSKNAYLVISGQNVHGVFTSKKGAEAATADSELDPVIVVQVTMNEFFTEAVNLDTTDVPTKPSKATPVRKSVVPDAEPSVLKETKPKITLKTTPKKADAEPVEPVKAAVEPKKAAAESAAGKTSVKKTDAKKDSSETCSRVKRGKTDPCGAAAKNEHDGEFYCNPCFKIASKDGEKKEPKKAASKVSTIKEKLPAIMKKFESAESKIAPLPHRLPDGTFLYIYEEPTVGKLVFDKGTKSVTGMFKNGLVVPLSPEATRWCEASNVKIYQEEISDDESVEESAKSDAESENGSVISDDEEEEEEDDADDE